MKTDYKYLEFKQSPSKGKTEHWDCLNKRSQVILGNIRWLSNWRQYCYFPIVQAVYSSGCLNDIADFLNQLNKK